MLSNDQYVVLMFSFFLVFELYVYVSVLTLYTNYFSFLVPRTDLSLKCTYQYCQIVISYFFFFLRDSC